MEGKDQPLSAVSWLSTAQVQPGELLLGKGMLAPIWGRNILSDPNAGHNFNILAK